MDTNAFDHHKLTYDVFVASFALTPRHCLAVWIWLGADTLVQDI